MTSWRRRATIWHDAGWRRWTPVAAFVFVAIALVVQMFLPPYWARQMGTALDEINQTFEPARRLVRDIQVLHAEQVGYTRGTYILELQAEILELQAGTGEEVGALVARSRAYRDDYVTARATEADMFSRLAPLIQRLGPAAEHRFERAHALAERWHALDDRYILGEITGATYVLSLGPQFALNDSVRVATRLLEAEIDRVAALYTQTVTGTVRRQLGRLNLFSVFALLATVVAGWSGWRQLSLLAEVARAAVEERRLRDESERRRKALERATESRARLTRGFSHDVKNPLSAADGFLQLLEEGVMGPLDERQEEAVSRARCSIDSALQLIDDLLEVARIESGQIEIRHEPVAVGEVARDVAEAFRARAEAKGLTLVLDRMGMGPRIVSDERRIRQVLGNLLSNAVKYTDRGTVEVRVAVRDGEDAVGLEEGSGPGPGRWVAIDVADTGPGIPEDQIDRLFREFSRGSTGEGSGGAGVGLAISRAIARALGGEVTVASEVGRGSTFTLWLPMDR